MFKKLQSNISELRGSVCRGSNNSYLLSFGKNDTAKLGEFIYRNIGKRLRLHRKYDLFQKSTFVENREYLRFNDAREYARGMSLKNKREWEKFSRDSRPNNLPSHPEVTYANCGWHGWHDWLHKK